MLLLKILSKMGSLIRNSRICFIILILYIYAYQLLNLVSRTSHHRYRLGCE